MNDTGIYDILNRKLVLLLKEISPLLKHKDLKERNGESRKRMEKLIERKLSEAHSLIKDIEKQSFQASMSERPRMNREIRQLKSEYDSLEQNVTQRQQLYARQASYGYHSSSSPPPAFILPKEVNERTSLLRSQQSMDESSSSLLRSNKIAHESEQIGHQILHELDGQRGQLIHARDMVSGVSY